MVPGIIAGEGYIEERSEERKGRKPVSRVDDALGNWAWSQQGSSANPIEHISDLSHSGGKEARLLLTSPPVPSFILQEQLQNRVI